LADVRDCTLQWARNPAGHQPVGVRGYRDAL